MNHGCQFPTSQMDISRIILATYGGHSRDNPTDVGMRLKPEDPSDVGSLKGCTSYAICNDGYVYGANKSNCIKISYGFLTIWSNSLGAIINVPLYIGTA
jgi:hypothetical protein